MRLNTEQIQAAVPALLNNVNQETIAKQIGTSQASVSRLKSELSDQLEQFQLQLIQSAGQETVSNITTTIGRANQVLHNPQIKSEQLSDYKTLLELSHKKEVLVAQSMGILPSQTGTTVINNILNVNTAPNQDNIQRIQELIQARHDADIDAIDAEYVQIPEVSGPNE